MKKRRRLHPIVRLLMALLGAGFILASGVAFLDRDWLAGVQLFALGATAVYFGGVRGENPDVSV